jgi:hypothetical protein
MIRRWQSWIVMLASCLFLWAAPADAHIKLKTYTGGFTSSQVFPCDTLCTGGPLTGGLAGTLSWRMDLMEPTDDPDVVKLTGVNTVTTANGSFQGIDYTYWNLATGDFVDVTVVSSGTGVFAGVKGTLIIQGFFDPALGQGVSKYVAILKLPH